MFFNFLGVSEWVFPGFSHTKIPTVQRNADFVDLEKCEKNAPTHAIVAVDTEENERLRFGVNYSVIHSPPY